MPLVTIVIGWQGLYTLERIYGSELGNGLYFVSGLTKHKKKNEIRYFGITERLYRERLKDRRHAVELVTRKRQIWLGQIEYPASFDRDHLELAEGCLIYYWGVSELNKKKLAKPPKPVCLISRWLKPNGEVRMNRRYIYRDLPDVLWWDGQYWRTGNLKPPYRDE
jgi:hypothetical protein